MELIDTKRFTAVEPAIYSPLPHLLRHEKKAKRFTATEHAIYAVYSNIALLLYVHTSILVKPLKKVKKV